ncbi:MAG: hypothetical protein ACI9SK_000976 [Zhongshania sp.]|jgi:hypothetical protein
MIGLAKKRQLIMALIVLTACDSASQLFSELDADTFGSTPASNFTTGLNQPL